MARRPVTRLVHLVAWLVMAVMTLGCAGPGTSPASQDSASPDSANRDSTETSPASLSSASLSSAIPDVPAPPQSSGPTSTSLATTASVLSVATTTAAPTTATTATPTEPTTATTATPAEPAPTAAPSGIPLITKPGDVTAPRVRIGLAVESRVADIATDSLAEWTFAVLNATPGWPEAGFTFEPDPSSELKLILTEPAEVDALCLPLETHGEASCQNGPIVALNAKRWREAFDGWDGTIEWYRTYLVNHEVGHLIGQRHPAQRCPHPGALAGLMEPQTAGLKGCVGNGQPQEWEIGYASERPVLIGPDPAWQPPRKPNLTPRPKN